MANKNTFYLNGESLAPQTYQVSNTYGRQGFDSTRAVIDTDTSSINGATSINMARSFNTPSSIAYVGNKNIWGEETTGDFTHTMRFKIMDSAFHQMASFNGGGGASLLFNHFSWYINGSGDMFMYMYDETGNLIFNNQNVGGSLATDVWHDVGYSWDNSEKKMVVTANGSTLGAYTSARNFGISGFAFQPNGFPTIGLGLGKFTTAQTVRVDEMAFFNYPLGTTLTSFFVGSGRSSYYAFVSTSTQYTDPGANNVANGIDYIFNFNTLTGTLSVPVASTGPAGTVPMNELKEQVRYALATNNTSTGAPTQNLSEGLSRKVKSVLKINPDRFGAPDDNAIPAVTVFTDSKEIEQVTIATNQLIGKRRATVNLKVMGMTWEPHTNNLKTDPADEECEKLMENIERVIRAYDTLGDNVRWHIPTNVTYHSFTNSEETHFRAGILDLQATLYY